MGPTRHRKKTPDSGSSPKTSDLHHTRPKQTVRGHHAPHRPEPNKRVITTRRPPGLNTAVESGSSTRMRRWTSLEGACPTEDDRKSQIWPPSMWKLSHDLRFLKLSCCVYIIVNIHWCWLTFRTSIIFWIMLLPISLYWYDNFINFFFLLNKN